MRQSTFWIPLVLVLVACGTEPAPDQIATLEELPTSTIAVETATPQSEIFPTPTEVAAVLPPTESPTEQSIEQPGATATEITATEVVEIPTSEPVEVNGPYENTYYRGLATAPITMIDYSDFL